MPQFKDLPPKDQEEIQSTRHTLNGLFHAVLNDFESSSAEVKFPAAVQFGQVSLDSVSAKVAAGTMLKLHQENQLLLAIEPGFFNLPLYSVNQCAFTDGGHRPHTARFIGSFFVGNFFARCLIDGPRPEDIVQKVVSQIVYQDALLVSQKVARAGLLSMKPDTLVSIYSGPEFVKLG